MVLPGNAERVRVFVYEAVKYQFFAYPQLILSAAVTWPDPFSKKSDMGKGI